MPPAPAISCDFRRVAWPGEPVRSGAAEVVAGILDLPDDQLDYLTAKIAFDRIVDPDLDEVWVRGEVDRLIDAAGALTHGDLRPAVKLGAVRTVLYEAGPWNEHRPFAYDMSDPLGMHLPNKLLHNLLRNRLGQCVSMPALFVILADRLGLNVALASAPEHIFVRYTDDTGHVHNIEATSSGHPARDDWIKEQFSITDRAIESGIYLRTLNKGEGIGVLASTVIEGLYERRHFQEAMQAADLLLRHDSLDVAAMIWVGTTAGKILNEIRAKYPASKGMPLAVLSHAQQLIQRNRRCFARAEQLGWRPSKGA